MIRFTLSLFIEQTKTLQKHKPIEINSYLRTIYDPSVLFWLCVAIFWVCVAMAMHCKRIRLKNTPTFCIVCWNIGKMAVFKCLSSKTLSTGIYSSTKEDWVTAMFRSFSYFNCHGGSKSSIQQTQKRAHEIFIRQCSLNKMKQVQKKPNKAFRTKTESVESLIWFVLSCFVVIFCSLLCLPSENSLQYFFLRCYYCLG